MARRVEVESKSMLATGAVWIARHERVHWACLQFHCFSSRARLAVTSSCGGHRAEENARLKYCFTDLYEDHVQMKYRQLYLIIIAECKGCDVLLIVLKWKWNTVNWAKQTLWWRKNDKSQWNEQWFSAIKHKNTRSRAPINLKLL